jgi:hypothetical protein
MTVIRAVPNIKSDRPAETRDFFLDLLGFEVAMDMGWVVTVASPTNRSVQVSIIGNDDMAAPGISVEVPDVDAVHARAVERGLEIAYSLRDEVGSPALHASRAERHARQRRLSPLALSLPRTTQSASRSQVCSAMKARSPRNHSDRARATSPSPTPVV